MSELRAPFIWFGGKARAAEAVWQRFGNVPNYVEPFAATCAVLLARPEVGKIETVNDLDCYLANFWRSIAADPIAVATWSDRPVNEADMHAWSDRLLELLPAHRERMHADPDYFDAKLAGLWVWGVCTAIGGNWLASKGGNALPRLCGWVRGNGMHALPAIGHSGRGIHSPEHEALADWFQTLAARFRRVRVACGDWKRVLSGAVTGASNTLKNMGMSPCGVFLDPPYGGDRASGCYLEDSFVVASEVRDWALEHGADPHFRIALCGYEGEHDMPADWSVHEWKAQGGHSNRSGKNANRLKERIWFSPHCLPLEATQRSLFAGGLP